MVQNRSKNEDENEDEKKALLGTSWVDFGTFRGAVGEAKTINLYWFYHYFLKIVVLEDKMHPRAILGRFGSQNAPKWEAKRDPRGTKNDTKMTSKF